MRARSTILAAALAFAILPVAAPNAATLDAHAQAIAALGDIRASVREIVRIEDGYAVGHGAYLRAAHRALNALVGRRDDGYVTSFGDPGDGVGTLGHLDAMLDTADTSLWTPAISGAKINVLAAAENLQSSTHDAQMEDYEADLTHAIANLALVTGRSSQTGVFGGIAGALANTSLGVPAGAVVTASCAPPARAPAYGVVSGRLLYVTMPRGRAANALPNDLAISRIVVRPDDLVLYTAAASESGGACANRTASVARPRVARERREAVRDVVESHAFPALYTAAQAHGGALVYRQFCVQCHATDLQGSAGPAVAGTEFLTTAQGNKWSLADMRTTIFQNMPFSNPGSLTPKQYADVTAFLLASNCYAAGALPFPTADKPAFARIKMTTATATKPTSKSGVCAVK